MEAPFFGEDGAHANEQECIAGAVPTRAARAGSTDGGRDSGRPGRRAPRVVTRVAHQLGIGVESLRYWVKQAEIDAGTRPGITTEERRRIAELEKENRELRRSNEILKAAASFFARELDPGLPK
jgi:transposase